MKRRKFIQNTSLGSLGVVAGTTVLGCKTETEKDVAVTTVNDEEANFPMIIATWNVPNAVKKASEILREGKSALDAIEEGCKVEEADPENHSVGYGGLPDRDGNVTLDACIMNSEGDYGSVVYLQDIKHPISVARKIMEESPHAIIAGKGAQQFALEQGFEKENLLTEASKEDWEEWKETSNYKPIINIENHDTIGMLAIDKNGNISGGCTTSGVAYKMAGRVGDSPIIGAGLFVDNEIGAATATGLGEEVLKTVGSFLIVELMRQGMSPQKACEEAILRIVKKSPNHEDFQVGFIAVNKKGETGSYSIHEGFYATVCQNDKVNTYAPDFYLKH